MTVVILDLLENTYGVPQGSILQPSLFWYIYINDPSKPISFSNIHSFADEANIFYESKSLQNINKKINYDMHRVTNWLRTNRISLNVAKTKKNELLNEWLNDKNK